MIMIATRLIKLEMTAARLGRVVRWSYAALAAAAAGEVR
jgi:hypothetical protein